MKDVRVKLIDQNGEMCGETMVPLVRTSHVTRAITEHLRGEVVIKIEKDAEGQWTAQVEI